MKITRLDTYFLSIPLPQPVRYAMQGQRQHTGIEHDVKPRARGRIAGFDGIEIGDEPGLQAFHLFALLKLNLGADRRKCQT